MPVSVVSVDPYSIVLIKSGLFAYDLTIVASTLPFAMVANPLAMVGPGVIPASKYHRANHSGLLTDGIIKNGAPIGNKMALGCVSL